MTQFERNLMASVGAVCTVAMSICIGVSIERHDYGSCYTEALLGGLGLLLVWKRKL